MLEKVATIKRSEYSPLGCELRKQTGIAKDQYKFFKEQTNNNREDHIRKEEIKIVDVDHGYIGDVCKDLIDDIFKSRLRDRDLRLIEFGNQKLGLTNIDNNYLEKKILMRMIYCLISKNSSKICRMLTIEYIGS